MSQGKGKVYLVGAGPGDFKLITLKGLECVQKADIIIYDRLVSSRLLAFAKPGTELIYVGKRTEHHTVDQEKINHLLVDKANEGKVVARLKGGDPFIFGRGGEEAEVLAENEIPFEVVPGVSSAYAVPAYAGIPATYRGLASGVAFVTGHENPNKVVSDIDWERLATSVETLIFLMGVHHLPLIVEQMVKNGRPKDTPVALIRLGTTTEQETLVGTLETIVKQVEESNFHPPAITIIGKVVRLRDKLKWFEKKPLFGKKVLVTRSSTQASDFVETLEELGAEVFEFPTIKIIPPESYDDLDRAIRKLSHPASSYDWLIFTSANGVTFFFERLKALGKDVRILKDIKLAAIGPATAKKLENLGLNVDYIPLEYRAEGVIEGFEKKGVAGARILIPRAEVAREILPQKLAEMGAEVDLVATYRTVADDSVVKRVKEMLLAEKIDIITFTSSSTVKNFVQLLKDINLSRWLKKVKVACIGPITADTARELGIRVDAVAEEYTIPGLVKAIKGM